MRAEDLVFWLDTLRPDTYQSSGVLCQRHADSMVVPRHWTLDDLREPVPRLFRPPTVAPQPTTRRRRTAPEGNVEQLLLPVASADGGPTVLTQEPAEASEPAVVAEPDAQADPTAWTPTFDESDDLGGLLAARSPLLARAFRGDDRPRQG